MGLAKCRYPENLEGARPLGTSHTPPGQPVAAPNRSSRRACPPSTSCLIFVFPLPKLSSTVSLEYMVYVPPWTPKRHFGGRARQLIAERGGMSEISPETSMS